MERKLNINIIAFILLMLSLLWSALAQRVESGDSTLIGKWKMSKVMEADEDVTKDHNPDNDRWIAFKGDGTFESGGQPFGPNTGKYTFSDSLILYLDSDAGPEDDSEWSVQFEDQTMTWKGVGSPRAKSFTLVHRRDD